MEELPRPGSTPCCFQFPLRTVLGASTSSSGCWDEAGSVPSMTDPRPVLVVDLGAQYAQLIARRVREAHVYSEIVPHDLSAKELATKRPAGIILSGGPLSVYEEGS